MCDESNQKENNSTLKSRKAAETDIPRCQPCEDQGQNNTSTHWCMTCPDFICEGCHTIHMTLRSTRNHVILKVDDYKEIGEFLTKFDNRCKNHKGEIFNYFCFTHNTPCCCVCKDKNHNKDCDVRHEDEISVHEENCQVFLRKIDIVEKRLCEIAENIKKNEQAYTTLNSERELLEKKLSAGRQKINNFYDKFEAEIKTKFGEIFSKRQASISSNQEHACEQRKTLGYTKNLMEIIKNLNTTKLQTFLIDKYIQKDLDDRKPQPPYPTIDFKSTTLEPLVKVDYDKQSICLSYEYKFPYNPDDSNIIGENTEENGSSTIEDELRIRNENKFDGNKNATNVIEAAADTNITVSGTKVGLSKSISDATENVDCSNKTKSDRSKTKCGSKETTCITNKSSVITTKTDAAVKGASKESKSVTNPTTTCLSKTAPDTDRTTSLTTSQSVKPESCKDGSSLKQNGYGYQVCDSFYVERRNKYIKIVSIGFIEPDIIAMSEISEKRVLFYRTNGFKKGEVGLEEEPGELAIIETYDELAVGASKMIMFINSTCLIVRHKKSLKDYIKGVDFRNNYVFACLQHGGIVRLDRLGNIIQRVPFIKGSLHICLTTDGILYYVKMNHFTNELYSFALSTRKKYIYSMNFLCGYHGIASDMHGNVYLGEKNSKVFKFDKTSKAFSIILSEADDVCNITSFSCSSNANTIVVACMEGQQIKTFRKLKVASGQV